MSTNELNFFLNSFKKPENYDTNAWNELLAQSKAIWKSFLSGKSWDEAVNITCKESYLMLVDTNGKLVVKNQELLQYLKTKHNREWRERLENIALRAISDKRFEKAELYFSKALKVDSERAVNYYRRAIIRMKLLNHKEALVDLTKAIELQPENEVFYLKRAQLFRLLDVDFKAMSDLNKAIKLNPNNAEAYEIRGKFRHSLGDRAGAQMDLNKSLELINDRRPGTTEFYNSKAA